MCDLCLIWWWGVTYCIRNKDFVWCRPTRCVGWWRLESLDPIQQSKGLVTNYYREGGGGGLQNGKSASLKHFAPPSPQDRVKLFTQPFLKGGISLGSPFNMAKTSSYRVKTTPKHVLPPPPFSMAKTFSPPPPFRRGKTSRVPLPFSRPPPTLPVISDQSLSDKHLAD